MPIGSEPKEGGLGRSMPRVFGYARPTATSGGADTQTQQLAAAGAETIFVEKHPPQARKGLRERGRLFNQIGSGDILLLQTLDRLGTTLEDMLQSLAMLVDRGVAIKVLDDGFETAPDQTHLDLLRLLTAAHSALRSETIKIGVAVARANGGAKSGTPAVLSPDQWEDIETRIRATSVETVAKEFDISRQTLWAYRRRMAEQARPAKS